MSTHQLPPKLQTKGYLPGHSLQLFRGGKTYFNRLTALIGEAKESIFLLTYIFADDSTGQEVANALKAAARRGVKVSMMVDGYASQSLPAAFIRELEEAGIRFRYFEPLFKSRTYYFGRRMHQKVVVMDARVALVAGMNIADRYNDTPSGPAWLDFGLEVQGPVALELCRFCRKEWRGYLGSTPDAACNPPFDNGTAYSHPFIPVKICRNDFVKGKNQISGVYIEMLRNARTQVIILSSYFLPGRIIRRQLVQAVRRGVEVKVITAGESDIKVAKNAERWLYDYLLRNGVQLYEYQANILHGKIAVCDGEWMTAGSYNINNISAYASVELNLAVRDPAFTLQTQRVLEEVIRRDCLPITAETQSRSKNIFIQFTRWCSYYFIRFMVYLFTFYYRQKP